jgi:plasmid stability protein
MPSIQVRDLPEQIYRKLQINAKKDHRSLSQQAIVTLKKGLGIDSNSKERRGELVAHILSQRIAFDIAHLEDPVNLIREDRER